MEDAPPEHRRTDRLVLACLLIAFAAIGLARLNHLCLLEPDSSDYLFTSRALVTLAGYTEIDHPDQPAHTLRPPGLPLLLAPVSLLRPYDVVSAKLVVLGLALVMLGLAFVYARRVAGRTAAVAVLVLLASGPYTLLHATEVLSEIPFILSTLAILLLVARRNPGRREWIAVTLLLAFLPFLRTVGVALIIAIVPWSLIDRSRRMWLASAGLAAIPTGLWVLRNGLSDGPTYLGALRAASSGGAGIVARTVSSLGYYIDRLTDVLLPGVAPGQPLYERFLLGDAPDLGGLFGLALPIGLTMVAVSFAGMFARREKEGGLAAAYVLLFVGLLAIYPPRHERLAWPLVPILLVYLPLGLSRVAAFLRSRVPRGFVPARIGVTIAGIGLVAWQAYACAAMVATNLKWHREGDRFYAESIPPVYYADWQAAGRWLAENAPKDARILTRHSDVGFTARLYQDSLRFEELAPARWRARISQFGARYLVVPATLFGKLFQWHVVGNDPVYRFTPVYEARDVTIFEVSPNRAGTVTGRPERPREADIEAARGAAARHPGRIDLRRRLAELLNEDGRGAEGVELLREAVVESGNDVRLQTSMGSLLLELERYPEALDAFRTAASLPEASALSSTIERGIGRAERGPTGAGASRDSRVRQLTEDALWNIGILRFDRATEADSRALALAPSDAGALYIEGELLQRLGRTAEAVAAFERARTAGHPGAGSKLSLLAPAGASFPAPETLLERVALYGADGTPGVALELLERTSARSSGRIDLMLPLAELYEFYGEPRRSAEIYRAILQANSESPDLRRRFEKSLRLSAAPSF